MYASDPMIDPDAERFAELTFSRAIEERLGVMDLTALSMCMENDLPVIVFDFKQSGNIKQVIEGATIGTLIHNAPATTTH